LVRVENDFSLFIFFELSAFSRFPLISQSTCSRQPRRPQVFSHASAVQQSLPSCLSEARAGIEVGQIMFSGASAVDSSCPHDVQLRPGGGSRTWQTCSLMRWS